MTPEAVVARTFNVALPEIHDDTSPSSLVDWDSLGHITLIMELESAFGTSFSPEESVDMTSVAKIKSVLAGHGIPC